MSKLISVKIFHTIIWICFNVVIFYLSYAVILNKIGNLVWLCIGIIFLEGVVLLLFKGICPLTIIARRYSASTAPNFDIYLPVWLAKYNKLIYTIIFIAVLGILTYRIAF